MQDLATNTSPHPQLEHERYAIGQEPKELERFGLVYTAWRAKCRGNMPPRFEDIDLLTDFIGEHGRVAIGRLEGEKVISTLVGSDLCEMMGQDTTGCDILGTVSDEQRPFVAHHFHMIAAEHQIGIAKGRMPLDDRTFLEFEALDLPLVNDEGETTHLLATMICG